MRPGPAVLKDTGGTCQGTCHQCPIFFANTEKKIETGIYNRGVRGGILNYRAPSIV